MKPASPDQLLLTVEQAGELLACPRSTAYALVKCGAIPSVMLAGRLRVSRKALDEYVARLTDEAEAQTTRLRGVARLRRTG